MNIYGGPTKRVGLDIPEELKTELDQKIPYGTLSSVIRTLLLAMLDLFKREGYAVGLKAIMKGNVKLTLVEETQTDET